MAISSASDPRSVWPAGFKSHLDIATTQRSHPSMIIPGRRNQTNPHTQYVQLLCLGLAAPRTMRGWDNALDLCPLSDSSALRGPRRQDFESHAMIIT